MQKELEQPYTNSSKVVPLESSFKLNANKKSSKLRFHSKRGLLIHDDAPKWLQRFYIQMNSRTRFIIDFISFLNLFYISISISLVVGFGVKMNRGLIAAELISILYSCFVVAASLRTPVMLKGEATLKLKQVITY